MRLLQLLYIATFFLSCSEQNGNKGNTMSSENPSANYDSSIHPLLEIGSYYVYEIKKDSLAGVLLAGIRKEEDSVYYGFILSGRLFAVIPDEKEFRRAGVWGVKIPTYPLGAFTNSFSEYSISERNLLPHLERFKKIGHVQFSRENTYGSLSIIDSIDQLAGELVSFEKKNLQNKEELKGTGMPSPEYTVFDWSDIVVTSDPNKIAKPEVIWVLSPKTANPAAAALMKEAWWWDPADDLAPFGNDDGADAFALFKDWRENNKSRNAAAFVDYLQQRWGMSFSHIHDDDEADLPKIEKENTFYRDIDRAIIGLAFAQFVLEGNISPELKKLGIKAIKRTNTAFGMNGMEDGNKIEYKKRLERMENILSTL